MSCVLQNCRKVSAAEAMNVLTVARKYRGVDISAKPGDKPPLAGRREKQFTEAFRNQPLTRPEHWGGYRIKRRYL